MKKDTPHPQKPARKLPLILLLSAIPFLIGLAIAGMFISRALYKPVIGFLDVPDKVREAIEEVVITEGTATEISWKITILDPSLSIKKMNKAYKKTDILITQAGARAEELTQTLPPDQTVLSYMPTAIRMAGNSGTKQYGTPLLLDHFELARNVKRTEGIFIPSQMTLDKLEKTTVSDSAKSFWFILCAGGDDATLLTLLGALSESIGGETLWNTIRTTAKEKKPLSLLESDVFSPVLDVLIRWRHEGLLHPEWFRMNKADVQSFMNDNLSLFVCMTLSDHREILHTTIQNYDSSFFPAIASQVPRFLTAPSVLIMTPQKKRVKKEATDLRNRLLNAEVQTKLSGITGFAPVSSTAAAPDRQADEARLWAAATERPLPSFFTALYSDPADVASLAKHIRELLAKDGTSN